MADTNTTVLNILKMETDSHDNSWGDLTNDNWDITDRAAAGWTTRSTTGATDALSQDDLVERYQRITGTLIDNQIYTITAAVTGWWIFENATSGNFSVTVKVTGQTGVVIPQGEARVIRCNGTDVVSTNVLPESAFNGKGQWLGTLAFSTDAYSATPASYATYVTAYRDGLVFRAYINNANATTTPTFNYNSLGAKTIVHSDGSALTIGELSVGLIVNLTYHSTADKWYVSYTKAAVTPGNVTGAFLLSGEVTPAQITSNQNDYAPTGIATASTLYLSADADNRRITGITTGAQGRVLMLRNSGSKIIKLMDNDSGSLAANRFSMFGVDRLLMPGSVITLYYRSDNSKWTILATRNMWREIDLGALNKNSAQSTPVSHGLGGYPTDFEVYLECTTTDLGYSVGDRVKISPTYITPCVSTTELTLSVDNPVEIVGKSSHDAADVTASSWKVIVRLFE
jgi:hypothetical protein